MTHRLIDYDYDYDYDSCDEWWQLEIIFKLSVQKNLEHAF